MGIFCLLIVNDDFRCQHIVSQVLQHCNYEELHTGKIMDALNAISDKRDTLNPVLITNAHRLGEKGFQILNQIQTQLNFDIIYMTPDDDQMVELKRGEEISMSAYAVNISNLEDISCLWESAIVKEKAFMNQQEETSAHNMAIEEVITEATTSGDGEESRTNQKRKRKETEELTEQQSQEGGNGGEDDHPVEKKPRVVWTKEMHRKFLEAIEILGPDKTFPKKIVELMNEPGLTRENVASHLQKYRLCLKRNQEEAAANCNNGLNNLHRPWFFSSSFQPFGFPYQQGSCGMISSMPSSLGHGLGLGLSRPFTTTSHGSSFPFTSFRISGNSAAAPWNSESVKSFIGLRFTTDGKSLEFGQTATATATTSVSCSGSRNSNEIQNEMFSSVGTTEITEHSNFPVPPPNNNNNNNNSNTIFGDCNSFEQEPFLPLMETSLPVPDDYCTFQQSHEEEPLPLLPNNNNNNNNSSFLHEIPTWNDDFSSGVLPQEENGASMDEIAAAESVLSIVSTPPQENSFPVLLGEGTTAATTIGFENITFPFQESSVSSSTPYQIPVQESSVPLLLPSSVQDDDFDCFQLPVEDINSFLNETAECSNSQLFWKGVYDYAYHNSAC